MKKKCSQMNTLDKIILQHQSDIDDLEKLSILRKEKWKTECKKRRGTTPNHYNNRKDNKISLQYVVIEDSQNKRWAIYDSNTEGIRFLNFGEISISLLNSLILYSPKNIYHQKYFNQFIEMGGTEDSYKEWQTIILTCADELKRLFMSLTTLNDYEKVHSKIETEKYIQSLWLDYRYCFTKLWADIVTGRNATEKDFEFARKWADYNEIQELVNHSHAEALEIEETLHYIMTKKLFIYHDFIGISVNDSSFISGNTYVTNDIINIFSFDLLHILKGDTQTPRKCPRCGQLYFSNNNKSKYCNECKSCGNIIRQENRKNNTCRYLHKQITDLLNNYYDGSEEFRIESNYYWAIITGKVPKQIPASYDKRIKTEKSYLKWLENYKLNLKS